MSHLRPDLAVLAKRPVVGEVRKRRRGWWLPVGIFVGFGLLFVVLYRDRLLPARGVRVVPAMAVEAGAEGVVEREVAGADGGVGAGGRVVFQASGWVEPDPLPVKVAALTDGFVDRVEVLQGEVVKKGEVIATLVDVDSRLARDAAVAEVAMLEAEVAGLLAGRETGEFRLAAVRAGLLASEADAGEVAERLRRYEGLSEGSVPETERIAARYEDAKRKAEVAAARALIQERERELKKIDHEVAAMRAKLEVARAMLAQAELAHERTRVVAPMDGRVMRLMAMPGQKKMVTMEDEDSSTIAVLYDPGKLQVRVDVPLADASGLAVGQPVRIRCNLLPDEVIAGEVTRIEGMADLQRNTLQAKVRILEPREKLRPEMLCRAEFLRVVGDAASASGGGWQGRRLVVFVPEEALGDGGVWVCDPDSRRVSRRPVEVGDEVRGNYRRLDGGLRPGEWVVTDPKGLRDGQRVAPELQIQ